MRAPTRRLVVLSLAASATLVACSRKNAGTDSTMAATPSADVLRAADSSRAPGDTMPARADSQTR